MSGQPIDAGLTCPDCDSDFVLYEAEPGIYGVTILHDETCPTYRAREARINRLRAQIAEQEAHA
ncbi:hypothetical protein [Microbacterium sp. Bi121]|uniref:hypothetical protein n=1 Tax=Microbacterium sp. Bi121 TaxID=2822348 RepID=UPI001D20E612|nr:hypothetical protein [Microbacterium sp. Bi121]CAH0207362.1 hypothetical protein SRABI121_02637 [Microbacterium sp. Bi121]